MFWVAAAELAFAQAQSAMQQQRATQARAELDAMQAACEQRERSRQSARDGVEDIEFREIPRQPLRLTNEE